MSDTINPSGAPQTPPEAPVNSQIPVAPQHAGAPVAPEVPQAFQAEAPAAEPVAAGQVPPAAGMPGAAPVPPMGQVPPFQGQAPAQQNIPGMPLFQLTGGMKFGWAVVGFFVGPIGILLAWLTNAHNFPEAKSAAVKFSLFGFLAQFLVWILVVGLFGCAACAAVSSIPPHYYY
ncbi:MAG: hypothetical protein Q4D92_03845 [Slackia sp.]|nr:hypothetical protein [Slackia sp.]